MAVVKEGLEVTSVIIQEGVPTFESIDDAIAEPVVYMIDRFVVGGFYRVHTDARQGREPQRARARSSCRSRSSRRAFPISSGPAGCAPNRFYAYGVVARLAQLAAAIEIEELEANPIAETAEA